MSGKRIGYVRVSTTEQNPDRQLEGVEVDKKFIEYASGSSLKRPVLEQMLDYAREDDAVFVHSLDRLARNVKDLQIISDSLLKRNVSIHFIKENINLTGKNDPISQLMLILMAAFAEFELSRIKERQMEGVALAKKAGKYKGRKKKVNPDLIENLKHLLTTRKSKVQIAKDLGITRVTLYRYLEEFKLQEINA